MHCLKHLNAVLLKHLNAVLLKHLNAVPLNMRTTPTPLTYRTTAGACWPAS